MDHLHPIDFALQFLIVEDHGFAQVLGGPFGIEEKLLYFVNSDLSLAEVVTVGHHLAFVKCFFYDLHLFLFDNLALTDSVSPGPRKISWTKI